MAATAEVVTEKQRREAWLADRRTLISSTDVAKLFGLKTYGRDTGPMSVFVEKHPEMFELEPDEDEEPGADLEYDDGGNDDAPEVIQWGLRLQRPILEAYADRESCAIRHEDPYAVVRVPGAPWLGASLDSRRLSDTRSPERPIDAKNVGWFDADWGEQLTDECPEKFIVQGHVQMMATEQEVFDLAALGGGRQLRIYRIQRDPELCKLILDRSHEFYEKHVVPGVPPVVDGSEAWTDALARTRQAHQSVLPSNAQFDALAPRLRLAGDSCDAADLAYDTLANELKELIGEYAGVKGAWGSISFRKGKDGERVDRKAVLAEVQARCAMGESLTLATFAAILKHHTTPKPGVRSFRPTWKKR